ncbi:MAG: primosomal protein N' [Clostridiales Family XIII bacterium]|jgi:primosomal protein N' (replication factor Y)|nr:primosomal protein N' [Clostridiales Family XIII bacterium]
MAVRYVDVAIGTKSDMVDDPFTYAAGDSAAKVGDKVLAPFSGSHSRGGYVVAVRDSLPEGIAGSRIRNILSVDADHSLPPDAVSVSLWMHRRYFCRLIDALACFAPPAPPPKRKAQGGDTAPESAGGRAPAAVPELTAEQQAAFAALKGGADAGEYAAYLIHGVTGSGKTELYMRTAAEVIAKGRKVIVLVPEISLTPQLTGRFMDRFGPDRVAVMHSKLSKGERYAEWARVKRGEADIAIGARSVVFAPFENIGAIIVDEEHETTYKSDMTPKYDTVEVALKRAARSQAICVLGSATPSVVSMYRARSGVYRLLELKERYNGTPLPRIEVVDMREELKSGNRSIFSRALYDAMNEKLAGSKQTILFLNRRGYSTFISCRACGYVMRCPECGISMTYHKARNRAECHFCGLHLPLPPVCPECESGSIRHFGIGTEKVEELTRKTFPDASVARLDLDSTSRKGSVERILGDFESGKTDILIGTQMVAKGLDYDNVSPVGIIAADVSLNIPDFRAAERTFQLITQTSGRAGRGDEVGEVYVQTYWPEHPAIESAARGDYDGFYETETLVRRTLSYPPYSDIYRITVFAASDAAASAGAEGLCRALVASVGEGERGNILGPQQAPIHKRGDDYAHLLHVKVTPPLRSTYERVLAGLKKNINTDNGAGYRIMIEVNPFSLA